MSDLIVEVQSACPSLDVPSNHHFQTWALTALRAQTRPIAEVTLISIRIVDEAEGAELNQLYRQKDGPTNVLSFPMVQTHEPGPQVLGDLVFCAPKVADEATAQHKPITAHWAHLTVHGTLHLLGYDHQTETEALEMERLETHILQQLGFADPYQITE